MIEIKKYDNSIYYSSFVDEKFKFNNIEVNFIVDLKKMTATENAVVAFLLRKRCKKYNDSLKLGKKLRSLYGADFFCDILKKGDRQIISFGIYILDDFFAIEKENLTNKAFSLLKEFIFFPAFDENGLFFEKDIIIEKQNLKDNIKSLYADKRKFAFHRANKFLFEGTNFEIDRYGYFEDIEKLSTKSLKKAYINLLEKSQIFVFYGGYRSCEGEIINFLDNFAKREDNLLSLPPQLYFFENIKQKQDKDHLVQAKLILGFAVSEINKKFKFIDNINNFVMSLVFGGVSTSLLFSTVREKLSLCYYCRAFYDSFTGVLWVESGVESKNIEKAIDAILEQFEILKKGEFEEDCLKKAVSFIETSYNKIGDSVEKMANYALNSFIKKERISIEEKVNIIKKISKKDIVEAAKKFSLAIKYLLEPENI